MKIINRFGGSLLWLLIIGVVFNCCMLKPLGTKNELEIVDARFLMTPPLASVVNLPAFTVGADSFQLTDDAQVHVYGVGELIYNLASGAAADFFKSDNIVLYLGADAKKNTNSVDFEWSELAGKTGFIKRGGIEFVGWQYSDSLKNYNMPEIVGKYYAKIKIPFTELKKMHAVTDSGVLFNVSIGNADEEFKLRSKVSLSGSKNLTDCNSLLTVKLCNKPVVDPSSINAVYGKINLDSSIEAVWATAPVYKIANLQFGVIKGKYDFEALVRLLWDKENLYLLFDIQDAHRQSHEKYDMTKRQTFLDYGWIENVNGEKIWEMNANYSKHAGGALKNQYVDTVLPLTKGKYYLRYASDESHSYNDWDDDPPLTTFYGIKIYK